MMAGAWNTAERVGELMRTRYILLVVAMLAICCALGACGGTSGTSGAAASASADTASPFAGTWIIVSQEKVHNEDLEAEKEIGRARFVVLDADGTARFEYLGVTTEGTYRPTSDTAATLAIDDPLWGTRMTIEDKLLVVEGANGLRYRFQAIPDEERLQYDVKHGYADAGAGTSGEADGNAAQGSESAANSTGQASSASA